MTEVQDPWFDARIRELNAQMDHEPEPYRWRSVLMCDYCGLPLYLVAGVFTHVPPESITGRG